MNDVNYAHITYASLSNVLFVSLKFSVVLVPTHEFSLANIRVSTCIASANISQNQVNATYHVDAIAHNNFLIN